MRTVHDADACVYAADGIDSLTVELLCLNTIFTALGVTLLIVIGHSIVVTENKTTIEQRIVRESKTNLRC